MSVVKMNDGVELKMVRRTHEFDTPASSYRGVNRDHTNNGLERLLGQMAEAY